MRKKKKAGRHVVAGKKTAKRKQRAVKKAARFKGRKGAAKKAVQPRVWRRVGSLAADALAALETDNLKEVRNYLEAIRAVSTCADEATS